MVVNSAGSALDESSGEITLVSAGGGTSSAAVTRLSLIHRTRAPWAAKDGTTCTWVYIRRRGRDPEPFRP